MTTVLLHLHPDFSQELSKVIENWNLVQNEKYFIGIRPKRDVEKRILTGGEIELNEAFQIAARMRTEAGYTPDDEILMFTEKRIFTGNYFQLYFGGSTKTDPFPIVDIVSLDFTRKFFNQLGKGKDYVFQGILSNILNAQAQGEGLATHDDTRGCILDFCNNMPDILVGLENGPKFCPEDTLNVKRLKKDFLFELANVVEKRRFENINDSVITKRILSINKPRLDDNESAFDYDVALSFAGEDRPYAERLATKLHQMKIKVFYDGFEKARLWGEDLFVYLSDLYRLRAKYCIMFLSQHYADKLWTNHERQAAQNRAFKESQAYILPIRLDNTNIPGILDTVGYLNWHDEKIEDIADCVRKKLLIRR